MLKNSVYNVLSKDTFFDSIPILTDVPNDFDSINFSKFIVLNGLSSSITQVDSNFSFTQVESDFTLFLFAKESKEMDNFIVEMVKKLKKLYYNDYNLIISSIYPMPNEVFGGYNCHGINITVTKV